MHRALSIRQPYAELILRGIKTVEYRSRPTRIVGERFLIYASKTPARPTRGAGIATLAMLRGDNVEAVRNEVGPPPWMLELALGLMIPEAERPTGVIVGSAVIEAVERGAHGMWEWRLADVRRDRRPAGKRVPTGRPQPVWFHAFAA